MAEGDSPTVSQTSSMMFVVCLVVLTVVGAGAGVALGLTLASGARVANVSGAQGEQSTKAHGSKGIPSATSDAKSQTHDQKPGSAKGGLETGEPSPASSGEKAYGSEVLTGEAVVLPLQPVLAGLAGAGGNWVRMEAIVLLPSGFGAHISESMEEQKTKSPVKDVLAARVGEDILAYLRTVQAADLMSPTSLEHLREDLTERLRIRLRQDDAQLLINGLIVE